MSYRKVENIFFGLIHSIGDDLGIEFRMGTGKGDIPYKTNEKAHKALYSQWEAIRMRFYDVYNDAIQAAKEEGKQELRNELKQLLNIEENHG